MTSRRSLGFAGIAFALAGGMAVVSGTAREWDSQAPSTGAQPPARKHHALAYHRGLQRVVMYGGASREPAAQATSQLEQPAPRKHHAVTYDRRHQRVVLYGGASNTRDLLGDLWGWDGNRWTLIGNSIPSASHAIFADADESLVLIGGTEHVTAVWDDRWVPILQEPDRWGVAGAFDTRRGKFIMHGGAAAQTLGGTLEFDGEHWRQVAAGGPGARVMASMVFDTTRNIAVLFGGMVLESRRGFDDLWEWDGVRWREIVVTGERPEARMGFGMALRRGSSRGRAVRWIQRQRPDTR